MQINIPSPPATPGFVRKLPDRHAVFLCHCGKEFEALKGNVARGITRSCGCYHRACSSARRLTHGHSLPGASEEDSLTYRIWVGIRKRVSNPRCPAYRFYGGKGIRLDSRWTSYENFYADMGPCPLGYSIERADNSIDYTKSNCTWVPRGLQARNTSRTRWVVFNGERLPITTACVAAGLVYRTVLNRLSVGMDLTQASKGKIQDA